MIGVRSLRWRMHSGRVLCRRAVRACAALGATVLVLGGCGGAQEFSPDGELEELPASFLWPKTKAASSYMLRIFAPDGGVLFESKRLTEPEKVIGAKLAAKLVEAGSFKWEVRIYDGDRIAGRSDPRQVRLVGSTKSRSSP